MDYETPGSTTNNTGCTAANITFAGASAYRHYTALFRRVRGCGVRR